jgi:hypothetical protein
MWAGVSWTQHLVQMGITSFTQAGQNAVSFCTSLVMNRLCYLYCGIERIGGKWFDHVGPGCSGNAVD